MKSAVSSRFFGIANRVIGGLAIIAAVYFVLSINDLSVKGFIIEELKVKAITLDNENNNTELRIMSLQSYDNLHNRAAELKMVKVDQIEYVMITSDAMAKK